MIRKANEGNVILSDIPEIPTEISEGLRPYQNTRFAAFADWTADGDGMYVSTRFANVPQLHHIDHPGGMRRQVTFGTEPIREAWRRPHSDDLLIAMDVGGGEFYQLYLLDPANGQARLLTDGKSRNTSPLWSPDGQRIAFTSTRRDGRANDLWFLEPDGNDKPRQVFEAPDGSGWYAADWHPNANRLLVEQYVSITNSRVHVLDVESGTMRRVAGGEGEEASFRPIAFDADGAGIFLTTDHGSEFRKLAYLDLTDGAVQVITEEIDWDVEFVELSPDRRRLAFTTNENGGSRVYLLDPVGRRPKRIEAVPIGVAFGLRFSPNGQRLGFTLDTGVTPADAHVIELEEDGTSAKSVVRWTFSEAGGLDPRAFVPAQPVAFPTFDGREIPAFLYLPSGNGPHPVIIHIHGGPEGQSRPLFSGVFQSWIGEVGAAVIDPNVRGSAGYGKSYLELDNGVLREDSVRDIGALLDWIADQPLLDEKRVMVYGGSYGGYMVLASLIHFGDRLRAGVDIVGISDFISFLENTQDYRRDLRRVEYGDERDPEMRAFFERISPLRNAHRIHIPLFVIQGQNDPRVPVTEAEQIVEQVRANGRPVWYMNALNEGHGYARKENQDLMREAVVAFMKEHL